MNKIARNEYPNGHSANDFKCFGPAATKDGEFDGTMICDMGCFKQDGGDTNKYYNACVTQSTIDNKWYTYFEWGRTGALTISFQFIECSSKDEAIKTYTKQLHSKNDKRGEWVDSPIGKILQAKKGKDCYLVRPQATRSTGLPDAKTITQNDGSKKTVKQKTKPKKTVDIDNETLALMRDLNVGTVNYTKSKMADSALPTQLAIDEARDILKHAMSRTKKVGNDVTDQVHDKELKSYTTLLYSRIPKNKELGAKPETWILSKDNISMWQQDLDAFESALYSTDMRDNISSDPFDGMNINMRHLSKASELGKFIHDWASNASLNRHSYIKQINIKNIWEIERKEEIIRFSNKQEEIFDSIKKICERPILQPKIRPDLTNLEFKKYYQTNTTLLFHGSRSVNISGLLREGFRFPKELTNVIITGAMFSGGGAGVYYADDIRKSVGYTSAKGSYWSSGSGAIKNRDAFMILCDVICGNPHVAQKPHPYTKYPSGTHCIFGKAGYSGVQNNEWIILDKNQYKMRYLIEFGI